MALGEALRRGIARRMPLQRRIARNLTIAAGGADFRPGALWAVTMVRDEADIIGYTVRHLLNQGVDYVLVCDNLSRDDTPRILADVSARFPGRVLIATDSLPAFHQGRKVSHLVNEARTRGARFVIPFDADEFWFAECGTLAEFFARMPDEHRVIEAELYNALPAHADGIDLSSPGEIVLIDTSRRASTKIALRPHRWVWVDAGNHTALDLGRASAHGLRICHVPYRTFDQLDRKVVQGAQALAEAGETVAGDHWRSAAEAGADARRQQWRRMIEQARGRPMPSPVSWSSWMNAGHS